MNTAVLRTITRIVSVLGVSAVIVYVLAFNFPIFGLDLVAKDKDVSTLTPNSRVKVEKVLGTQIQRQTEDLTYFTTKSEGFDTATIRFEFMSTQPEQEIALGYKDREEWSYFTKPVNVPFLNNLNWRRVTLKPPHLYTKSGNDTKYYSYDRLIKEPPNEIVGTYFVDPANDKLEIDSLPDYQNADEQTVIDTPLRGSHTFYTYLQFEPFQFRFEKKDLNWYEGEDIVKVRVFKGNKLLTERIIEDDGITDSSRTVGDTKALDISYEGGNPQNGVYKIQLIASGDTVITAIKTNLNRIVFEPPLFVLPKNWEDVEAKKVPVTVFSDAQKFSFRTYHNESMQDIRINADTLKLDTVQEEKTYESNEDRNIITLPLGDVVINGQGYFAFKKEQYFTPFVFKRYDIRNASDLERINYLVTDYEKPFNGEGNWKIAEVTFDLKDAFYSNGKLSWIVRASGLGANGQELYIRNMEVTLHKNPIIGEGIRD